MGTSSFTAFTLKPADVPVVFPLIHVAMPDIDLAKWRNLTRALVERPSARTGAAIGLRNAAGYVCGVLLCRVDNDLRYGSVLSVGVFAALDIVGEDAAVRALLDAAEVKARELGCTATHIRMERTQASLSERLAVAGYRPEATLFCQPLGARRLPH